MIINVPELNRKIKEYNSLDKVAQEMGTSRRSLNRYLSKFYTYITKEKQFIAIVEDAPVEIDTDMVVNSNIKPPQPAQVTPVTQVNRDDLEGRIELLEEKVVEIYNMVSKSPMRSQKFELDSKVLNGETTTRSFKANEAIVKDFLKLCETKLRAYAKQDLVSQALLEFTKKYK